MALIVANARGDPSGVAHAPLPDADRRRRNRDKGVSGFAIEVVRGRIDDDLAAELISFWTAAGVLDEAAARERLDQVVCVLRDGDGGIAGVNSVFDQRVELIGGRRFWIYRSYLLPEASE